MERARMRMDRTLVRRRVSNPLWQRARICRAFDPHGYLAHTQVAVALAAAAFVGLLMVAERRADLARYALPALGTVWAVAALMAAVQAAASVVGDRRRGFFDLVLATPLSKREIVDGVLGAVWEHQRWSIVMPLYLTALFGGSGAAPTVLGAATIAAVGLLLCLALTIVAVSFSLAARTYAGALTATAAFVVVIQVAVPEVVATFGPAVAAATAMIGTVVGLIVYAARPGLASLCVVVSAAHALVLVAVWSVLYGSPAGFAKVQPPAAAPAALLTLPITAPTGDWAAPELLYGAAVAASILVGRWWLIQQFDRLAPRIPDGRAASGGEPRPTQSPERPMAGRWVPRLPGEAVPGRVAE
jgi:hypothetical protein